MKLNYYGFVGTQGMIRKVIASTWQNPELLGEYVKQTYSVENVKATATATISGDAVNAVNLVYSGDKYTYAPNVTFSTGNARAEAVLGTDGKIESITVTNGGSGYSTAPTVDIEAPEGYQEFPGPADAYRFVEEFEQEFK